jgi:hypothetical protein
VHQLFFDTCWVQQASAPPIDAMKALHLTGARVSGSQAGPKRGKPE